MTSFSRATAMPLAVIVLADRWIASRGLLGAPINGAIRSRTERVDRGAIRVELLSVAGLSRWLYRVFEDV